MLRALHLHSSQVTVSWNMSCYHSWRQAKLCLVFLGICKKWSTDKHASIVLGFRYGHISRAQERRLRLNAASIPCLLQMLSPFLSAQHVYPFLPCSSPFLSSLPQCPSLPIQPSSSRPRVTVLHRIPSLHFNHTLNHPSLFLFSPLISLFASSISPSPSKEYNNIPHIG